jgi:uncharacterized protein (TIGR03790 family)
MARTTVEASCTIIPRRTGGTSQIDVRIIGSDYLSGTTDTLFYFTGSVSVPDIGTNVFPSGAVADNLTSAGGMLTDSGQMSALEFVKGPKGATGTFGTVSEPCAWPSKFPSPAILIRRYTAGETLIEAYRKSVEQTFQGAFVGEPLARPWLIGRAHPSGCSALRRGAATQAHHLPSQGNSYLPV